MYTLVTHMLCMLCTFILQQHEIKYTYHLFIQLSRDLRQLLDAEGLQLIQEFPFNTGDDDDHLATVVRRVRVS